VANTGTGKQAGRKSAGKKRRKREKGGGLHLKRHNQVAISVARSETSEEPTPQLTYACDQKGTKAYSWERRSKKKNCANARQRKMIQKSASRRTGKAEQSVT